MKRYIAIVKTANGTMPMKVRAKKESEVEGKLKGFRYESILKILSIKTVYINSKPIKFSKLSIRIIR